MGINSSFICGRRCTGGTRHVAIHYRECVHAVPVYGSVIVSLYTEQDSVQFSILQITMHVQWLVQMLLEPLLTVDCLEWTHNRIMKQFIIILCYVSNNNYYGIFWGTWWFKEHVCVGYNHSPQNWPQRKITLL